jgi:DNA repair photolyase
MIVFWTKNAEPMLQYLDSLDHMGIGYYFQFTVNDYEGTGLEPGLPSLEKRISTFRRLSERLGKERVVWRFDPFILTNTITPRELLERVKRVGDRLHEYTDKLVVSFADISSYRKVQNNLKREGFQYKEVDDESISILALGLQEMSREWDLEVATCAEPMDLGKYGIKKNRCVDDELMIREFKQDRVLMDFLGYKPEEQGDLFAGSGEKENRTYKKDPGQREACGCIVSKDIGQYNTCAHLCVYCYANTSRKVVQNTLRDYDPHNEGIV